MEDSIILQTNVTVDVFTESLCLSSRNGYFVVSNYQCQQFTTVDGNNFYPYWFPYPNEETSNKEGPRRLEIEDITDHYEGEKVDVMKAVEATGWEVEDEKNEGERAWLESDEEAWLGQILGDGDSEVVNRESDEEEWLGQILGDGDSEVVNRESDEEEWLGLILGDGDSEVVNRESDEEEWLGLILGDGDSEVVNIESDEEEWLGLILGDGDSKVVNIDSDKEEWLGLILGDSEVVNIESDEETWLGVILGDGGSEMVNIESDEEEWLGLILGDGDSEVVNIESDEEEWLGLILGDDDDDDDEVKNDEDDSGWLRTKLVKGVEMEDCAEDIENKDNYQHKHAEYGDRNMKAEESDYGGEIHGEKNLAEKNVEETAVNHSPLTYDEKKSLSLVEKELEDTEITYGKEKAKYVDKNEHMTRGVVVEETRYVITEQTTEAKTGSMAEDANMLKRGETSLEADEEVAEDEEVYTDNFVINFFNFH